MLICLQGQVVVSKGLLIYLGIFPLLVHYNFPHILLLSSFSLFLVWLEEKDLFPNFPFFFLQEVDLSMKGRFSDLWSKVSGKVKTLKLLSADLVERDFISLLQQCTQLEELRFDGLAHILMTGRTSLFIRQPYLCFFLITWQVGKDTCHVHSVFMFIDFPYT